MADFDSTPDQDPDFGPEFPVYPGRLETLHILPSTSPLFGTNIYPAFLVQWDHNALGFRDRVPCYLAEANGMSLAAGYYNGYLVDSYLGLPYYATFCCPTGLFSSSSSVPQ